MRVLLAGFVLALVAAPTLAAPDEAAESRAPKLPVEGRNGSFTRVIPLEVPAFRGIEPSLRLVYDSASSLRNLPPAGAELGVGWSLQGVSAIQRVSGTPAPAAGQNKRPSGRGAPAYGAAGFAADSFLLDGRELIACTEVPAPASTPSCASAGVSATVYTSRVETYLRIRQNPSANSWEVTGRNGVRSVYTSLEGISFGQTYRWLLASVTDLRGNHVRYDWSCAAGHCTIASIRAYSQGSGTPASEIIFHTEARPDPITYGTGLGLRTMTQRISAIEVRSGGRLQSAYALTYETSKSTKLSRLIEVRKHGSDAAFSHGAVTGGTSLPPWRMTYSDNGDAEGRPSFTKRTDWTGPGTETIRRKAERNLLGARYNYVYTTELVGDFNGDGWATDHYLPRLCLPAKVDRNPNCVSTERNPCGGTVPGYVCIGGRLRLANGDPAVSSFRLVDFERGKSTGKLPESDNIIALGDFDGDGATELARADSSHRDECGHPSCRRTWVYNGITSKNLDDFRGDGFRSLTGGNKPESAAGMAGDFNGDGRDDFLLDDGRILLSGRGGGVVNWGFERINKFRKDYRFLLGDINGDGLSDVLINKEKTQTYQIYLSTGSGLSAQPPFNLPVNAGLRSLGDVNGDGLSDLIYSSTQGIGVLFSDGRNLTSNSGLAGSANSAQRVSSSVSSSGFSQFRIGDFNGDGRVDIVDRGAGNTATGTGIARSIGTGFESLPGIVPGRLSTTVVADYNGDGADDLGRAHETIDPFAVLLGVSIDPRRSDNHIWLSTSGQADLMTSFREPPGGLVTITYGSSARETAGRMPFIMQVVKSLTLDDGRGGVSTLNFAYEGGAWSREERQFLGFRKLTVALPCIAGESACPQQVRTYEQTPGCVGEVSQEQVFDAPGGNLLSQTTTAYAADTQLPFTCLASSTETRTYEGSGSRAVSRSFTYDLYGNTTQEIDNGVVEAAGDETLTLTSFAPNTGDYVVSCPWRTLVYQGSSSSGSLLSGTSLSYDGGGPGQPPLRCDKTRQDDWTAGDSWITTKSWSYDTFGNVVSEADGLGNTTATLYDGTYALYPVETHLPDPGTGARFRTQTSWDFACAQPATRTDLNGQVSSFSYDALCRETHRRLPGGYEERRGYENLGQPAAQRHWVARSPPGGQSEARWSVDYLDGFGRSWITVSMGPGSGKNINVARTYNQRWGLARQTEPYYGDEAPAWKSFSYDKLDRLVRTTNPDGSASTIAYGLGSGGTAELLVTALTDETGRRLIEATDADAKRVRRTRMKDAEPVTTRYQRDGLGRITRITDPAGNQWTYTYDGLGRRIAVNDPDLGAWTYAYDNASRLVTQRDAKGQVTELGYDALSRLTSKLVHGTDGRETTTNRYDQARSGFFNLGQLTSAVRTVGPKSFTQAFDYDEAGRLARRQDIGVNGQDYTQRFEYWPDGTLKRKRLADGTWTGSYLYDAAGRLFSIGNANAPSASEPQQYIASIAYNARGQTTEIVYGGGITTSFTYNEARGFLTRVLTRRDGQTLLDLSYARNAKGMVTGISSPDSTRAWAYGYDALDRLVSADNLGGTAEDRTYAYDDADNLIANSALCAGTALTYGAGGRPHAPAAICGAPVTYDANGNTLSYDPDGPGPLDRRDIAYDGENRPISVTTNGNTARFDYGPDGARAGKSFLNRQFFYLGADAEILVDSANTAGLLTSYLHADIRREGRATDVMVKDHLASNRLVLRVGSGVTRADYGPFGQPLTSNGSVALQGKAYINERFDPETGLQYLNARYYDPLLARFITPDTWDPDIPGVDINRYAYAGNDPVNGSDPTGHIREDPNKFPGGEKGGKHNRGSNDKTSEQASKPANETKNNCAGCKKVAGGLHDEDEEDGVKVKLRELISVTPGVQAGDPLGPLKEFKGFPIGYIGGWGGTGHHTDARSVGAPTKMPTKGETAATAKGRQVHRELSERVAKKPGWRSEPQMIGADQKIYKPDVVTPNGRIIEMKPNTPSGRTLGERQIRTYQEQLGMRGRVIYYDPTGQ